MTHDTIEKKLELAVKRVSETLAGDLLGLYMMGSITAEATPSSDLDLIVLLADEGYNLRVVHIQKQLALIAIDINAHFPEHQLVFWTSKHDHYFTMLPDVSYVRRSLPDHVGRLDAWCGLAKHTLLQYECSSARRLFGAIDLKPLLKTIPRSECLELFLLSTRTLAEGLVELQSADQTHLRAGINHVAKAGLRAIYAALIHDDEKPRNRYLDIAAAAKQQLPSHFTKTIDDLYNAKTGKGEEPPDLGRILTLMHYCESQIADTKRLSSGGISYAAGGESFSFSVEDIIGAKPVPVETYSRFPTFNSNYIHALYFLMSALEIIRRLAKAGFDNPAFLDFYFEELTTVSSFAIYNPEGIRVMVGRTEKERSTVDLPFGRDFIASLPPLLICLAKSYLDAEEDQYSLPWLSQQTKLVRLRIVLAAVSAVSDYQVDEDILSRLDRRVDADTFVTAIVDWQLPLLNGLFGFRALSNQVQLGLTLYRSHKPELSRRLLESVIAQEEHARNTAQFLKVEDRELSAVFSQAHHYLAISLHRMGDTEKARLEYEAALDRDPDNFSAANDYASFLLQNEIPDVAAKILAGLPEACIDAKGEVTEEVGNRIHQHAINLKQTGDLDSADFWYDQAIKIKPDDAIAYNHYGLLNEKRGHFEEAVSLYLKAIEIEPDYLSPYFNLALLLEQVDQLERAIHILTGAVELGLANEQALTKLANWHLKRGETERALQHYNHALQLDVNWPDALTGKASALLHGANGSDLQVIRQAAELYRRAFEADPGFQQARIGYETTLALLQRPQS